MGFNNTSNTVLFIDDLNITAKEENNTGEYAVNISLNADQYSIKMFDYMLF